MVAGQAEERPTRRKPGRPKGRPLSDGHREAIKAALEDGTAARKGWETRRANMMAKQMKEAK
jgi:hypothetical protein